MVATVVYAIFAARMRFCFAFQARGHGFSVSKQEAGTHTSSVATALWKFESTYYSMKKKSRLSTEQLQAYWEGPWGNRRSVNRACSFGEGLPQSWEERKQVEPAVSGAPPVVGRGSR